MKKAIIGLLAALIVLPACGGKEKSGENAAENPFTNIKKEASFKLTVPEEIAQGRVYYSTAKVDLIAPADSTSDLSKRILAAAFPEDSVSKSISEAAAKFLSKPVDFMQTKSTKVDFIPKDPENGVLLSKNVVIDTICSKDMVTFHIVNQGFTGGAHGYNNAAYVNYNTADSTVVDAGKLFADNNGVRQLILEQIAKNNGCKVEELEKKSVVFSVADVKVPENFYPDGDSLVFYYNPYEISSWAQGEVKVAIPVTALEAYASDYGKEFLKTVGK